MIIKIKGVEIDLEKIGINFTPNIEQIQALNHLAEFMASDKLTTVLSGSAGTGKSSLMRIFLEYDRLTTKSNVRLVAPTHKAKAVLSRLSKNGNVTTLHKLLGLKPDFNIFEFDARAMRFLESLNLIMFETHKDLLIVDEGSMVNDPLYDMLIKKMAKKGKIIFLGDIKQLAPVKQGSSSKVFHGTDYPGFTLTIVERQHDNPLLDTLVKLRDGKEIVYESDTIAGKGLRVHKMRDFQIALSESFYSLEDLNKVPQGNKILAYTNVRVAGFNQLVRKLMGCNGKVFNDGELLMAYDSYSRSYEEVLQNGSDYMIISAPKVDKLIPSYGLFPGYNITLKDIHTGEISKVFMLDPEADDKHYKNLAIVLEGARLKGVKRKYLFKNYFAITESFVTMKDLIYDNRVIRTKTLDYGYACTVHKSQGSSYTNVFVDIDNVNICRDVNERRQLEYVALSRPTHLAHILKK